jgi:hypothetical protein
VGDGALSSADHLIHLIQVRSHPDYAVITTDGDVEEGLAHGLAAAPCYATASIQRSAYLAPLAMILDRRQRLDGEITVSTYAALRIDEGDAMPHLSP